jgi:hypothetical protein
MRLSFIFPCLLVLSALSCKKPGRSNLTPDPASIPPLVLATSLSDTISPNALRALKLEKVTGLKVKYITGHFASYFEYEADGKQILKTISQLPFSRYATLADTVCSPLTPVDLALLRKHVSGDEIKHGSSFWTADLEEFELYECLKSPLKHTILIGKNSRRILHRIEG